MSAERTSATAARGRPRSLRARRAVLDSARALVENEGYAAATIEAIATHSGVAKTTIYRWWPNRAALVVDMLVEVAAAAAPPPTGGDPLPALHKELRLVAAAAEGLSGRLLIALLGEAEHDADIDKALKQRLFDPRRQATAKVIRRAQAAGALRRDMPARMAGDLLFGPLFYRKFIRHERVTSAFADRVFQLVLEGARPRPADRGSGRA